LTDSQTSASELFGRGVRTFPRTGAILNRRRMMKIRARILPIFAALALAMAAAIAAVPVSAAEEGHFDKTLTVSGAVDREVQRGRGDSKVPSGAAGGVDIQEKIRASHGWHWGGDVEARIKKIESTPPIEQNGNTIRVGHTNDHDLLRDISISYDITT